MLYDVIWRFMMSYYDIWCYMIKYCKSNPTVIDHHQNVKYDQILYIGAQVLSCSYPQKSPGTAWPAAVFRKAKSVGHVFFAVGVGARGSSTMWIKGHGLGVLTIVDRDNVVWIWTQRLVVTPAGLEKNGNIGGFPV